jgi:hypothetical protein
VSRLDRIMADLLTASPEALKEGLRLLTEDERERLRALAVSGLRAATTPEPAPRCTCDACSEAGGAGMPVHHAPPECSR